MDWIHLNSHLLQGEIKDACTKAGSVKKAIREVAKLLFSEEELANCSQKGYQTNKDLPQRKPLSTVRLTTLYGKYCFN